MNSPKTSASRQDRSSKRFAARARRPKPVIIYVDECVGRRVADALAQAGFEVRPGQDHFRGEPDHVWLPKVGAAGWIVLTKDMRIRRRPIEVEALLRSGVQAFVITATDLPAADMIDLVLRAIRKVIRICARPGPFLYNITRTGAFSEVSLSTLRRRARSA